MYDSNSNMLLEKKHLIQPYTYLLKKILRVMNAALLATANQCFNYILLSPIQIHQSQVVVGNVLAVAMVSYK